jgi:hypothetical protein
VADKARTRAIIMEMVIVMVVVVSVSLLQVQRLLLCFWQSVRIVRFGLEIRFWSTFGRGSLASFHPCHVESFQWLFPVIFAV